MVRRADGKKEPSPARRARAVPRDLWQEVFESLADAVVVMGRPLRIVALNPAAAALLGTARDGAELLQFLLEENPWLKMLVRTCFDTAQTSGAAQVRLRLPNREVEVSAQAAPVVDSEGRAKLVAVSIYDLSRHRYVVSGTEGDPDALTLSTVGLAHEVRNPLTGIKGAAELLRSLLPEEPRAKEYCDVILAGANRIAELVEQVMKAGGLPTLNRRPTNVHRILHQALAMAGLYPAAPPGINLECDFDPSLPPVDGDPSALERVFLNLIKNALEAVGKTGTIRLTTRLEGDFRISEGAHQRRFLRVEVSDSGKGATLETLFKPFLTTKATGSGLGLVLSRRLVLQHGGKIEVFPGTDSQLGSSPQIGAQRGPLSGLTFRVILPIAESGVDVEDA